MKALTLLIGCLLLLASAGCNKDANEESENPAVDEYVSQLKSGTYHSLDLPAFTSADIPALLTYRNETQKIRNCPCNPISSYRQEDCTLGLYVLWTIESIRAVSINSKSLIGRFPSQNPLLEKRDYSAMFLDTNESLQIAAKAYYDWWINNSRNNFDDFKNTDPLVITAYKWH